jgi:hypothetical protein
VRAHTTPGQIAGAAPAPCGSQLHADVNVEKLTADDDLPRSDDPCRHDIANRFNAYAYASDDSAAV